MPFWYIDHPDLEVRDRRELWDDRQDHRTQDQDQGRCPPVIMMMMISPDHTCDDADDADDDDD